MATLSAVSAAATALTPPSSSHGDAAPWAFHAAPGTHEPSLSDKAATATHQAAHQAQISPSMASPPLSSSLAGADGKDGNMRLADKSGDKPGQAAMLSPALTLDPARGRASPSPDWPIPAESNAGDARKRSHQQTVGVDGVVSEDSKWIHRDKLAKIESAELQAAGIYIPRPRAPSKQRRDRSRSRIARATESTDMGRGRASQDSSNLLRGSSVDAATTISRRDSRVDDGAGHYLGSNGNAAGVSRIPVAITSPAPIPIDFLERGSQAAARKPDTTISFSKPRVRSASLSASDRLNGTAVATARRSITDHSPKKNSQRRSSVNSRTTAPAPRPKTRPGPHKDAPGSRMSGRAGDPSVATNKAPEGDPPWMVNSYKPDPRLPPDQQLLPTVARRLQQEKWEKEGKFGDVYDRDFRPLNEKDFNKPPSDPEKASPSADDGSELKTQQGEQPEEWPLKTPVGKKSPPLKQGALYSPMPKINDKPASVSSHSPVSPAAQRQTAPAKTQEVTRLPDANDKGGKKGRCGCCTVM